MHQAGTSLVQDSRQKMETLAIPTAADGLLPSIQGARTPRCQAARLVVVGHHVAGCRAPSIRALVADPWSFHGLVLLALPALVPMLCSAQPLCSQKGMVLGHQ